MSVNNNDNIERRVSIVEYLDELCPFYMSLGCSLDEYWNGDTENLKYYIKKRDYELDKMSYNLWMQGLYNMKAFSVAYYNLNRKKGSRPEEYFSEPISITEKSEKQIQAEQLRKFQNMNMKFDIMELNSNLAKLKKKKG